MEPKSRTSTDRGKIQSELPMIFDEKRMRLIGGVVEFELDCLHISMTENQTPSVFLRKNGIKRAIHHEPSLTSSL